MKCSRCGEECKDNQAFCLKCGTPIQVVPDFNLIEAELANNVGELMNEIDEDKKKENKQGDLNRYRNSTRNDKTNVYGATNQSNNSKQYRKSINDGNTRKINGSDGFDDNDMDYLDDDYYVDTMPDHDVEADISLVDIQNLKDTAKLNDYQVDGMNFNQNNNYGPDDTEEDENQSEKKAFKVKAIIFGVIATIVVVIAILLLSVLNKDTGKDSFTSVYNTGYDYYTSKDYDNALAKFLEAKKIADNKNEKIKVNKSLLATYENMDGTEDKQISVLKELIELSPKEYEYYEKLVEIYDAKGMSDEITALIDSIDDVSIKSQLSEYNVATPKFSEKEGDYDTYISIKLISDDNKIYYTLDGTEPTTSSTQYTEDINLNKEGKITVKAIAVNEKGLTSKVASATYNIKPNTVAAPVVTPDGGKYTENTEITITVPEGMKCYYTYGTTPTTPTTSDTEYTEPVKMLRGKNIFSAILVSESGVESEVTQNVYQLELNSAITYDDALVILKNYVENNNIAAKVNEEQYVTKEGLNLIFSYNCIADIDNVEYYVINATEKDSSDKTVKVVYYGVDTVTSTLVVLEKDTENAGKYKLTE